MVKGRFQLDDPKTILALLMLLALLGWLLPVGVRLASVGNLAVDDRSYFHLRIAEEYMEGGPRMIDALQLRPLPLNPYHLFLMLLGATLGPSVAVWTSTFLIAFGSVFLLGMLLTRLDLDPRLRVLVQVIWIISPAYQRISLTLSPEHLGLILVMGAIVLFTSPERNNRTLLLGASLVLISLLLGPFNFFLGLAIMLAAAIILRQPILGLFTLVTLPVPLVQYHRFFLHYPLLQPFFVSRPFLLELVTDLGAPIGLGTFAIFLALFGTVTAWKRGIKYHPSYLPWLFLFSAMAYFTREFTLYFSIPLAILAAMGFMSLWRLEWEVDVIRNLTLVLISCGLLFTGLSYLNRMAAIGPTGEQVDLLQGLSDSPPGMVLSHEDNGFVLEYFTGKKVFRDGLFDNQDGAKNVRAGEIFSSRNLGRTRELLEGIGYIYIDPEMRQGKVWERDDEGLLFLLRDENTFELMYGGESGELWRVTLD